MSLPEAPRLQTIYFYITNACNLRCAHCWLSMQGPIERGSELTTAEIMDSLDQALPLGLESIKITGGEPLVRDDIPAIVRYAGDLGLSTTIETNALLLDDAVARALAACQGLDHVAVSLDGATAESHASLRGSQVSFSRAVAGIERLVSHCIPTQIICSLHRGNAHELDEMIAFAAQLGAFSLKLNPITQLGRGQEMAERGELLSLDEVLALNRRLDNGHTPAQTMSVYMSLPVAFLSLSAIRRQGLGGCGVTSLLGILPDGQLSICGVGEGHVDLVFGNIRETPLAQVWYHSPALARIRREVAAWPTGICRRCLVRSYCPSGHCRAEAYVLAESLSAPAPLCQASYDAGLFPSGRFQS